MNEMRQLINLIESAQAEAEHLDEDISDKVKGAILGVALLYAAQNPTIQGIFIDRDQNNQYVSSTKQSSNTVAAVDIKNRKVYNAKLVKLRGATFDELDRLDTELYFDIMDIVKYDNKVVRAELYTGKAPSRSVYLYTTHSASLKNQDYKNFSCNAGMQLASDYMEEIPNHRSKVGIMVVKNERTGESIGTLSHKNSSYEYFKKLC